MLAIEFHDPATGASSAEIARAVQQAALAEAVPQAAVEA